MSVTSQDFTLYPLFYLFHNHLFGSKHFGASCIRMIPEILRIKKKIKKMDKSCWELPYLHQKVYLVAIY